MKRQLPFILAIIFSLTTFFKVNAQSSESIWMSTNATEYKTGETVLVTINAISGTQIQGLTFQIRYDPVCVKPVSATSPVSGLNGLPLPQTVGLVDATFASTTPQTANGVLAEVRFITLGECQTSLVLESAALAIRNESGFAAPLAGISLGEKNLALNIQKEVGSSQLADPVIGGTPLPLSAETSPAAAQSFPSWLLILFSMLVAAIGVLVAINLLRKP